MWNSRRQCIVRLLFQFRIFMAAGTASGRRVLFCMPDNQNDIAGIQTQAVYCSLQIVRVILDCVMSSSARVRTIRHC